MAGIGFELRKILKDDTYSSYIKSFFSSLVFISGPWIVTIISFIFLYLSIGNHSLRYFVIFTHIMAYALIITSPLQASIIRYVADLEFSKKEGEIFSSLMGVVFFSSIFGFILACVLIYFSGIRGEIAFYMFSFIVANTIFWPVSSFTTLLKDYKKLTFFFFLLMIFSTIFIYLFFDLLGGKVIFFFFSMAYFIIETFIILQIYRDYNSQSNIDIRFSRIIYKQTMIWLPGLFYILGMWIDKFVFWFFSPESICFDNIFFYNSYYDINFFLASIFIIPTLSLITIKSETNLALCFSTFTKRLIKRCGIKELKNAIFEIDKSVFDTLGMILKYHGMLALGLIFFSEYLLRFIDNIHVFKILTIGILLQAIYIFQIMVLYYLDSRKRLLIVNIILFLSNGLFSYITLPYPDYYGMGYSVSLLLSNLVAFYYVRRDVFDLNFLVFKRELQR